MFFFFFFRRWIKSWFLINCDLFNLIELLILEFWVVPLTAIVLIAGIWLHTTTSMVPTGTCGRGCTASVRPPSSGRTTRTRPPWGVWRPRTSRKPGRAREPRANRTNRWWVAAKTHRLSCVSLDDLSHSSAPPSPAAERKGPREEGSGDSAQQTG